MDIKIKLWIIRGVYLIGFLLDGLTGIDMILSTILPSAVVMPYSSTSPNFQFAMGWGASLMLGWTVLLLWGAFKPLERKEVLLFTLFPVVAGLVITELLVSPFELSSLWIFQFCFILPLLIIGYLLCLNIIKSNGEE